MEVCRLSKRSFLPYIIHTQGLLLHGAGLNQDRYYNWVDINVLPLHSTCGSSTKPTLSERFLMVGLSSI